MAPFWYRVADPTSFLAITGIGIDDVRIAKKAFIKPFQKCTEFSIAPQDITLQLQAMTHEKLQLTLPAVFTIGPMHEQKALLNYARLLTSDDGNSDDGEDHVQRIVRGIIEGETRVIVSSMTMEEIFRDRAIFKSKVIENVQSELNQFGLKIYNANVKELQDTPGSEYFGFLSQKAHEGAHQQAKIDVAEARMRGEIGEKAKQGMTKQEVSKIEAETSILETQRKADKAKAEAALKVTQTNLNMEIQQAQIKASRAAEARDAELSKDVEQKKAAMELERQRATDVVKAKISRETAEQKADADAYTTRKNAEAAEYKAQRNAEADFANAKRQADATKYSRTVAVDAEVYQTTQSAEAARIAATQKADAELVVAQKQAEADFVRQKKKAEGMIEMAKGYGAMADVLGGPDGLLKFMMIEQGVYKQLADANASAVRGMQPKINVWNTGSGGETSDPQAPLRNMFQMLPPLFQTIQDQTGITPPNWMANMGPSEGAAAANGAPNGAVATTTKSKPRT